MDTGTGANPDLKAGGGSPHGAYVNIDERPKLGETPLPACIPVD